MMDKYLIAEPNRAKSWFDQAGVVVIRNIIPSEWIGWRVSYLKEQLHSASDPQGHFPLKVRLEEWLLEIPYWLAVKQTLYDILGTKNLYMHMPPMARFVNAGNKAAAVPPHRDVAYNMHMGRFVTVWVPLVPINQQCGGISVYPQSMRWEPLVTGETRDGWLPAVDVTAFDRIDLVPMQPGDIVIMHSHLVHASMPNLSDTVRLSLDYRFFGDDGHSTKHYLDLQTRKVIAPEPAHA